MAKYSIEISATAEKQLKKLPKADKKKVSQAMLSLAEDAFPRGTKKLTGYDDMYRIRVGRYRILYSVEGKKLIIIILKIGHRKDVYR